MYHWQFHFNTITASVLLMFDFKFSCMMCCKNVMRGIFNFLNYFIFYILFLPFQSSVIMPSFYYFITYRLLCNFSSVLLLKRNEIQKLMQFQNYIYLLLQGLNMPDTYRRKKKREQDFSPEDPSYVFFFYSSKSNYTIVR